jgi:hypothetical protein
VLHLPHSKDEEADLASGERATQGRGFVVVALRRITRYSIASTRG